MWIYAMQTQYLALTSHNCLSFTNLGQTLCQLWISSVTTSKRSWQTALFHIYLTLTVHSKVSLAIVILYTIWSISVRHIRGDRVMNPILRVFDINLWLRGIVRPANRDWTCQTGVIGCYSLCTLYSCNQLKRRRQGWPTLYVSMPGKRLSLVCCWGPAAFHLPG